MDKIDQALKEISDLRDQGKDDFQFVTLGMKDLASGLRGMAEKMDQMEGRMGLQEQRFDRMLLAVQAAIEGARSARPTMEDFKSLSDRVEALENRSPAA